MTTVCTRPVDIERYRGDTTPIVVELVDADCEPIAETILGASFRLTVSQEEWPDTNPALFEIVGTDLDDTNKTITFAFTAVEADNIGAFYYDVEMTESGGVIHTVLKGLMVFEQDITKASGPAALPDVTWTPSGADGDPVPSGGSDPWIMSWEEDEPSPWEYEDHDGKLTITPSTIGTASQHTALKPNHEGVVPAVLRPGDAVRVLCWLEPDQQFRLRVLGITGTLFESGGWWASVRYNASDEIEYEIETEYSVEDLRREDSWSDDLAAQTAGWFYVLLVCGVEDENSPGEYYHGLKFWPELDAEPAWDSGTNDAYLEGDNVVSPWAWWLHHQGLPFTDHKWRIAEVKVIRTGVTFGL